MLEEKCPAFKRMRLSEKGRKKGQEAGWTQGSSGFGEKGWTASSTVGSGSICSERTYRNGGAVRMKGRDTTAGFGAEPHRLDQVLTGLPGREQRPGAGVESTGTFGYC